MRGIGAGGRARQSRDRTQRLALDTLRHPVYANQRGRERRDLRHALDAPRECRFVMMLALHGNDGIELSQRTGAIMQTQQRFG